jgi:organic radical activating enzyme
MEEAKVSEIFLSYQGEGPFAGSRQLFLRFYGCNLECEYCDTALESYKSFTKDSLLSKVMDFEDDYNELAVTGGEPLLCSDFLSGFLTLYRAHRKHPVYLETNGTLPEELEKVIDLVDIVAMDFKLPSSCGMEAGLWASHKKFAEIAVARELIIKAVVTDKTNMDDIKEMGGIIADLDFAPVVVLQPVTPTSGLMEPPDDELLTYFRRFLEKKIGRDVLVMGQMHKFMGIK